MQMSCDNVWQRRKDASPFRETVSFLDERLVLGVDTVLLELEANGPARVTLNSDAGHDRLVALLAVAGRGHLTKAALSQLDASLADWRRGDRALAAIRLAFAPLPRIRHHDEAYHLFLAETALEAGLRPNELLRELGYDECTALLKFNPGQLRVPAGSGRRSGQWTSEGSAGGATGDASVPTPSRPAPSEPGAADGPGAIPVFFRPEPDGEDQEIRDKERGRDIGETEEDRILEGQPFRFPLPGGIGQSTPGFPDFGDPAPPETGAVPIPRPTPSPGGAAPPSDAPPDDQEQDDKGPACPAQQKDRPRGANANADAFEYLMSLIVNPLNPTPKQSPTTPNVVSQSYYLPTSTPDGKTSYDDCKQDDTPISIFGVRPGDMFEYKSTNFGWVLYYINSQAYKDFYRQVKSQNTGVISEGLGRQIYYCFTKQADADRAYKLLHEEFPNSHFLAFP